MKQFPVLKTERLVLREIILKDATAIFKIFADPHVTRYYDVETFTEPQQAREYIQRVRERWEQEQAIRWGITNQQSERVMGTCGFNGWNFYNRSASLGYDLATEYWGRGIMTEALHAVIYYGFEVMELNRIQALAFPANTASIRVLEKLGFQSEGLLRECTFWHNKFQDLRCFSLLRRDWSALP
jgi:ribosomal-protein-alanine N-acetyltransferase